jgi:hypothetical protein
MTAIETRAADVIRKWQRLGLDAAGARDWLTRETARLWLCDPDANMRAWDAVVDYLTRYVLDGGPPIYPDADQLPLYLDGVPDLLPRPTLDRRANRDG